MDLQISFNSLTQASIQLQHVLTTAHQASAAAQSTTLCGSYSGMPELAELGISHAAVLIGGAGSALSILRAFAEQIDWGRYNLERNKDMFESHELGFAQAFAKGDINAAVHTIKSLATVRPDGGFGNFSFPTPVVIPNTSLTDVLIKLSDTNTAQATQAINSWQSMSIEAASVAEQLHSIAGDLQAHNDGAAIHAACHVITEMAGVAACFSANAASMAASVTYMSTIPASFTPGLIALKTATDLIQDPVQKQAAEKLALMHFYSVYTPAIQAAVPVTRNLTHPLPGGGGGGAVAGMSSSVRQDIPSTEQIQQKLNAGVEQIQQRYQSAAQHQSAVGQGAIGQGLASQGVVGQGAAGSGLQAGLQAGSNMHAHSSMVSHYGADHMGTEHAAYTAPPQSGGGLQPEQHPATTVGGGRGAVPAAPGGAGMFGGLPGGSTMGGLSSAGSVGSQSGAGAGTSGGAMRGATPATTGRMPMGAGSTGGTGFMGGAGGTGGVGSAGVAGNDGRRKAHKSAVKGILQQVEQSKNQYDLLGPRPATIPGVIGDWVRKDPRDRTPADYHY